MLVTDVLGTHACCEAAVAVFRARSAGHLVVVSSVAGVRGMGGTRAAYASFDGVGAVLTEGIRADLLGARSTRGIRGTTVHPGSSPPTSTSDGAARSRSTWTPGWPP